MKNKEVKLINKNFTLKIRTKMTVEKQRFKIKMEIKKNSSKLKINLLIMKEVSA